jgi:hypothetical protein
MVLVAILFRIASINNSDKALVGFDGSNMYSNHLTLNANSIYYEEDYDREAIIINEPCKSGFFIEEDKFVYFIQLFPYPKFFRRIRNNQRTGYSCTSGRFNGQTFVYKLKSENNIWCLDMFVREKRE